MSVAPYATEADRSALAEILARPEFRDRAADASALRRLLEDLWNRLLEALGTAEAERYASLGRTIFLAAVAVTILLAWRALRRRVAAPGPAARRATPFAARPAARLGAEAAASALARGEPAVAVRLAYAAAAAAVGARATAGETLTGPELAARTTDGGFLALARLHDRTVFGRQPVGAPEARDAVEVARRLAPGGEP